MVERHAAVQLSIGKVTLGGLRDADREHEFLFVDDKEPVKRSFWGILLNMKVEGRKLWQCLARGRDGDWEGYYTNGRLCHTHKDKAQNMGSVCAGEIKFYLLKRGITLDSIECALRKSFTVQACRDAASCRVVGGKVLSGQAASYMQMFSRMECPSIWVDVTLGMLNAKK